jgi:hypothetical protein
MYFARQFSLCGGYVPPQRKGLSGHDAFVPVATIFMLYCLLLHKAQ